MWTVSNRTPYAAARNWVRDKSGVHHWLVALKATYDISPEGRVTLSDEQVPPLLEPQYRGEAGASSLRLDSDLLAVKPNTDVVLDASAYAPKGRPAAMVPVAFRVGHLEKTLVVHGLRVYYRGAMGMTMTAAKPFAVQPIAYEFAFGGSDRSHRDPSKHRIDMRNPVGRGFAVDADHLINQVAPAIEYPRSDVRRAGPAGFGPIASFWTPRLERGGTYDARWEGSKKPLLPDDYDERHAASAPDDQQASGYLRGGEVVALSNLTERGFVTFAVPKVLLILRTFFGSRVEEHRASISTIFLEPSASRMSVVWQSAIRVHARDVEHLDGTVINEKVYI